MISVVFLQEAEPNTELGWLLYLVLFFFLLMVVVGWWVSRRTVSGPGVSREAQFHHTDTVDDLTRIEGIGPNVAQLLNEAGIHTFEDLANANPADLERILDEAGLQMMEPEGWLEQARLAARGDWEEFEKLQAELKGGRMK